MPISEDMTHCLFSILSMATVMVHDKKAQQYHGSTPSICITKETGLEYATGLENKVGVLKKMAASCKVNEMQAVSMLWISIHAIANIDIPHMGK